MAEKFQVEIGYPFALIPTSQIESHGKGVFADWPSRGEFQGKYIGATPDHYGESRILIQFDIWEFPDEDHAQKCFDYTVQRFEAWKDSCQEQPFVVRFGEREHIGVIGQQST